MNWCYRRLDYDVLPPNLDKSIFQLNEKEAAEYYAWFIKKVPERVAYVSRICATELGVPTEKMDCSPESLILLWKWFRRRAKTEPCVSLEVNIKHFPNKRRNSKKQLTLETEYILRDIGMYLGETFRKNCPNIYWTYYTKPAHDFFVNHPLLKGFVDKTFGKPFEVGFEPLHMAGVQAAKIINKTSRDIDLFDIYNIWSKKTEC